MFPSKHLDVVSHILGALCSVSAVLGYRVTLTTGSRRVYVGYQTPDRQSEESLASHWSIRHNNGFSLAESGPIRHKDNNRTWVTLISDGDTRPGRSRVHATVWCGVTILLCFGRINCDVAGHLSVFVLQVSWRIMLTVTGVWDSVSSDLGRHL